MISLDEATRIIKDHLPTPEVEDRSVEAAAGCYIADKITAPEPLPRFVNSAMDGYAVAMPENGRPDGQLRLPVVGESRAGAPFPGELHPGTVVRISTGARVPDGADLVVVVEDTTPDDDNVLIHSLPGDRANIRFRGEEIERGDVIASPHQQITPAMIAWLASFGITELPVFREPSVAVLTTGEELVEYTVQPGPGQIRNSNQVFGTHFLKLFGIEPVISVQVGDSPEETVEAIERAQESADLILVSGGVSVGEHDHVKAAAEELGFTRQFWKVAQKPGKPLYFAAHENTLLFGLPGNPVSVIINTVFHILPVLRAFRGVRPVYPVGIPVLLAADLPVKPSGRARLLMVKLVGENPQGRHRVRPVSHQASHMISGVVASDGIIVVPPETDCVPAGESRTMYRYPWKKML